MLLSNYISGFSIIEIEIVDIFNFIFYNLNNNDLNISAFLILNIILYFPGHINCELNIFDK